MIGYKGFDKDLKCKGFQYKEGETYKESEAVLCSKGFHFCEIPLDILNYYKFIDSEGNKNKFHEIEASGDITSKQNEDSKRACTEIKIKSEISLKDLIKISFDFIFSKTKEVYSSPAATSGDSSPAATSGNSSPAATSGNFSHAATSGDSSHAATSGDSSHAATSGDFSPAATSGNSSPAATSGKNSIACSIGINSKAKSSIGNWIVLSEYDTDFKVICVKTAKVDGKKIKANTFYQLKNKKLVEVK